MGLERRFGGVRAEVSSRLVVEGMEFGPVFVKKR